MPLKAFLCLFLGDFVLTLLFLASGKCAGFFQCVGLFLGEMSFLRVPPLLFLSGELFHFLLVVFPDLSAFLFRALLEQVYFGLTVLLLKGEQLGSPAFFLFLGVFFVFRLDMTANVRSLSHHCRLFLQIGCQFEIAVALCLQYFCSFVVRLLVVFFYSTISIVCAVCLRLHHIMSHTGKPAHVAFRIARLSRLVLGDLFVGFHSLVYQCLRLGLKEKHLYILLRLLCQDIVPLRYGIIIAESLAILAIQLLTLLLLLFLGASEVLQALPGGVYLKAGLDHLRPSL